MQNDELLTELDLGSQKTARSDTLERPQILPPPSGEPFIEYTRDLVEADVMALNAPRAARPRSLVRIHASHHSLARCLAAGMRPQQAALVTGYSPGRISQLQNDQAFSALVADYQAEAKSIFADLGERLVDLSLDAIEQLHEKLHESPELFTPQTLLDIVKSCADRTGHGPNSKVQLSVDAAYVDRPPKETFEDWEKRRHKELVSDAGDDSIH